ncbi:MAG TPA: family 16 glycoside hydrolase [Tepidisphaeraceae bacterium]|nr:family 16 glycoside hydrolase [Tepidisphaeraceae bacterium]
MRVKSAFTTMCGVLMFAGMASAVPSEPSFYGDPPDDHHPWAIHDPHRPQPKLVTPGTFSQPDQPGKAPSDAVILFDGTDLSKWEADKEGSQPSKWIVKDGAMECTPGSGYIRTKEKFGDVQLHIEWAAPKKAEGSSQGRGNSGIFLLGMCEIQVLDNYNNPTYSDGFAGSFYGINPPQANVVRAPGEYQVVDIVFRRPVYKDGKALDPGYVTVFLNGVLVQDHTMLEGPGGHMARTKAGPMPEKGPLKLQDHGNPVRYRNIWIRPLPPRAVEGSTDGYLSTEATMAKRKEIAAEIREDAAKHQDANNPLPEMLRLAESLKYEKEDATFQKVEEMAGKYAASIKQLTGDKLQAKKDEVKYVNSAFQYLARFNIIPATFGPKVELEKIIKDQGWDKK